jgi:hypothetical protein
MKRILALNLMLALILAACGSPASAPTVEFTPILPTDASLVPISTVEAAPTLAFDIQKLEGIWVAQDILYVRHSSDGKYTIAEDSIRIFLGRPLEATITVEGNLIKLSGEAGCRNADVGVYRIDLSEAGDSYTLTLVEDPCEWRKGGEVPAANVYRKLEALVLPGTYQAEVTQAEAEAAGGGDLLKYVGAWELHLNADNTFDLLQNDQPVAAGEYLSAGEQFTLEHADICSGSYGPIVRALTDDGNVTFSQDPSWTSGYRCKAMLLVLTGHPWVKP